MSNVIGPSGPGDICGDCGHFAFRHVPGGCDCSDLVDMGVRKEPCQCRMMLWNGKRWFGERLEQEAIKYEL
jgi:hypothetical protein